MPSVTTVTESVLNKPALGPWFKKVALENVKKILRAIKFNGEYNPINLDDGSLDEAWIERVIEESKKLPQKIAEEAADLGTRAHAIIDEMCKGIRSFSLEGVPEDLIKPVKGFLDWWAQCEFEVVLSEVRVASEKLGVGGSMDILLRHKKSRKLVVGDWKTSKSIYLPMFYQVAGYSLCLEEMIGEEIDEAWIIRFPKYADDPMPFEAKEISGEALRLSKAGFAMTKGLWDIAKSAILLAERFEPSKKLAKKTAKS